jgi:hypothetical protein
LQAEKQIAAANEFAKEEKAKALETLAAAKEELEKVSRL